MQDRTLKSRIFLEQLLGQTPDLEETQLNLIFYDNIQTIPVSPVSATLIFNFPQAFPNTVQGHHIPGALSN